jgi:hypothetical protein
MTSNVYHNLSPMQVIREKNKMKNDALSEAANANGLSPYHAQI